MRRVNGFPPNADSAYTAVMNTSGAYVGITPYDRVLVASVEQVSRSGVIVAKSRSGVVSDEGRTGVIRAR